jgi:hypothetical protein
VNSGKPLTTASLNAQHLITGSELDRFSADLAIYDLRNAASPVKVLDGIHSEDISKVGSTGF